MESRIANLVEASLYDPDKMLAPKDLWPTRKHQELKDWLDERERLRKNELLTC